MTIGASIFLIAIGAILTFAVDYRFSGIDISTVGVILMIAGAVGMLISLFYWTTASSRRARMDAGTGTTETVTSETTHRVD